MRDSDFAKFSEMLSDMASIYGKEMRPTQAVMFFRVMSSHSLQAVTFAMDAHSKDTDRGRFMPTPADLLAKLEKIAEKDGRPSPEEAWSTAIQSMDERVTVVWTTETAKAWADVGCALMEAGDKFNASRGFITKYAEYVENARKQGLPVRWEVSQGYDLDLRHNALETAYKAGLITVETVRQMLPRHNQDTGPIVAAIAGRSTPLIGTDKPQSVQVAQDAAERLRGMIQSLKQETPQDNRPTVGHNMRIFNQAVDAGVFDGVAELDLWMTKAQNREDMREMSRRIIAKETRHA